MNISQFQKQPREPYTLDRWFWNQKVQTPLGEFMVEFQMGTGDTDPPDDEMLKRASELVRYAETHGDYILDIVFGYYLLASESDWLEMSGVPRGLNRQTVISQVRDEGALVVSRWAQQENLYESAIYIVPLWDEEHALTLEFQSGQIVSANDSSFKIEDGVLRCF